MSKIRERFLKAIGGNYVRRKGTNNKFRLVYDVEVNSQASEVYGFVTLVYLGGERESLPSGTRKFPAVKDLEIISAEELSKREQSLTQRAPDAEEAAASQSVSNTETLSTSDGVPQSAPARVA